MKENEGLPSSSDKERSARITELQNTLNEYKEERVRREEKMDAFRRKFMGACDGHATERIEELMFGRSLR